MNNSPKTEKHTAQLGTQEETQEKTDTNTDTDTNIDNEEKSTKRNLGINDSDETNRPPQKL